MTQEQLDLPEVLAKRLKALLPADVPLATAFAPTTTKTIRINTLVTTLATVSEQLAKDGFTLVPVEGCPVAYLVSSNTTKTLTETAAYANGSLYIQNPSSMLPALLLDPQPGETILDLAAAPGSKTTQLATMMNNQGSIIANDVSRSRLFRLTATLQQQHITCVTTSQKPGEYLWQQYPEYFDRVLLDAPCSMEGRIDRTDPSTFSDWSVAKVKQLARKQQFLLRSAFSATKPGGILVYSTCTLSPEENEGVVNWLLEKEGGGAELMPSALPNTPALPGLTQWEATTYDPAMTNTCRVLPRHPYEGFFVAKIKKTRPSVAFM